MSLVPDHEDIQDARDNARLDADEVDDDYWFETPDPNENRGDLRDEGRNPDGSGESYGERNA